MINFLQGVLTFQLVFISCVWLKYWRDKDLRGWMTIALSITSFMIVAFWRI